MAGHDYGGCREHAYWNRTKSEMSTSEGPNVALLRGRQLHYFQGWLRAKRQYVRAGPCTSMVVVHIVLTTRLPLIQPVPIQLRQLDDKTSGD
jgi:hypothetical protein